MICNLGDPKSSPPCIYVLPSGSRSLFIRVNIDFLQRLCERERERESKKGEATFEVALDFHGDFRKSNSSSVVVFSLVLSRMCFLPQAHASPSVARFPSLSFSSSLSLFLTLSLSLSLSFSLSLSSSVSRSLCRSTTAGSKYRSDLLLKHTTSSYHRAIIHICRRRTRLCTTPSK